jgi:hypothetical protein
MLTKILIVPGIALLGSFSVHALDYGESVNANGPAAPAGNDPGIYYGSGNANGGFTVDRQNNVELGLRAHVRYPFPANVFNNSGTDNVYAFSDGPAISPPGRGSWNYDFSINSDESGAGGGLISDYTFRLAIDSDPGVGHTWNYIDPTLIPDNAPLGSTTIEQNSENPGFAFVGVPGYDKNIAGSYDFILTAHDSGGDLVAKTAIRVNVNGGTAAGPFNAPDGGSTALLSLLGFAGMLWFGKSQRKSATVTR